MQDRKWDQMTRTFKDEPRRIREQNENAGGCGDCACGCEPTSGPETSDASIVDEVDVTVNEHDVHTTHAQRHETYWNPERAYVRDALTEQTKLVRADEAVDEDLPLTEQHRHAVFGGGRWD